jgi:hypothetical protein
MARDRPCPHRGGRALSRLKETSDDNHPLYDIAAALARIFVVGMTITAFVAVPIMLAIALL